MSEFNDIVSSGYFVRAAIEAAVAGALGGVVGVLVVLRRMQFFVLALSHASLPAVVSAVALGAGAITGAALGGLSLAAVAAMLGRRGKKVDPTPVAVVLAGFFALGVVLQALVGANSAELSSYLVGSVLSVSNLDIAVSVAVGLVALAALICLRRGLLFATFDPVGAEAVGYSTRKADLGALCVVALSSAVMVPAVGTLLTLALLAVPASTARLWCSRLRPVLALSVVLGVLSAVGGLFVSVALDTAAGATMSLCAGTMFLMSLVFQRSRVRRLPSS